MHPVGANEDSASDALGRVLAEHVAALGERGELTIAELATAGLRIWKVRRDRAGTPRAQIEPLLSWAHLAGAEGQLDSAGIRAAIPPGRESATVVVRTSPGGIVVSRALHLFEDILPGTPVFDCFGDLGDVLKDVFTHSVLTKWYELVVVRRARSGKLTLGLRQLFPVGAQRGDRWPFEITCEAGDGARIVFAVVASEPVRRFDLVSVRSVRMPPGRYSLTAELARPGLVRFSGLPGKLEPELRDWDELTGSVPASMAAPEPVHLICAIEVSGDSEIVEERLARVSALIRHADMNGSGPLKASVIAYGPHSYTPDQPDIAPEFLVWAASTEAALTAVARLRDRGAAPAGYPGAAQIECVLADMVPLLRQREAAADGRPALVTAGSRQAFPVRVDARTQILPCPRQNSWQLALNRLSDIPGIRFGAIRDTVPPPVRPGGESAGDVWSVLGKHAVTSLDHADIYGFPERLALVTASAQHITFPIVDGE